MFQYVLFKQEANWSLAYTCTRMFSSPG